jgi:mono/diheme cytochrome c family protein
MIRLIPGPFCRRCFGIASGPASKWMCVLLLLATVRGSATAQVPPANQISTLTITTVDDSTVVVGPGSESRFTVVAFLGTECPLAKLYGPRLQRLADQFQDAVTVVGVVSNHQDSIEEIEQYAARHMMRIPMAKDRGQEIADRFRATRTPEVVVIDSVGTIRYRGRIDDQYQPGVARNEPNQHDLRDALAALVAGKTPPVTETEPVGCIIGRDPIDRVTSAAAKTDEPTVTYTKDIAPILNEHCLECHRPANIGPFAMDGYDEVAGWGATILEVIDNGRMPPWHAAPPHDRFEGARHIPAAQRDKIATWVDQGMPRGDREYLPPKPDFVDGWDLPRDPDLILPMAEKPMEVPASGVVEYQYFVVDPGLTEDRWVQAAQVKPGNRSVVHHAICFVRPPDGSPFRGVGWLGAYVPGQRPPILGEGSARRIPAGSKLVFQMHYTPTGRVESDTTRVGLVFAESGEVTHEVMTLLAINQSFEIPPGVADYRVEASINRFPNGSRLLSIMPHMHYRGTAFFVTLTDDAGERRSLLEVPRYDFNWQHDYRLRQPIELDSIDSLDFAATFDNSPGNPFNPDPTATVTWGDQTWEEMAVAFFDVATPLEPARPAAVSHELDPQISAQRSDFVTQFFLQFDRDSNQVIMPEETPESFRIFGFWRYDNDGNGLLDRDEIEQAAARRFP